MHKCGHWLSAALLTVCLSGASAQAQAPGGKPGEAQAASAPSIAPGPLIFHLIDGISYRQVGTVSLTADLYIPETTGRLPVVLFLHGGGWRANDRKQLRRQAAFLAERGFFGMAIDYRLAPANPFPAALEDASAAVAWLRSHAAEYHLNPAEIATVGSSAGGHLAAMLGVASGHGSSPQTRVQAVVAFNGIFDLDTMPPSNMVTDFVGSSCADFPQRCTAASPLAAVTPDLPPFLILHGTDDKTAPYSQALAMVAGLRSAHDPVALFTAAGAPHTFWIQPRWIAPSFDAMLTFLNDTFQLNAKSSSVPATEASNPRTGHGR